MDLHATVQRAVAAAGLPPSTPVEPLVTMLRSHVSTSTMSQHIAQHTKAKVQERAADGERFSALHNELRALGVAELDKFTVFLQRVQDEKAVVEMLRLGASGAAPLSAASSSRNTATVRPTGAGAVVTASAAAAANDAPTGGAGSVSAAAWEAGWLLSRPYLSGSYLAAGVKEQLGGAAGGKEAAAVADLASHALGALPVKEQESLLVGDLLCVLAGVEGSFIRSKPSPPASMDSDGALLGTQHAGASTPAARASRVHFCLPSGPGTSGVDPSLKELTHRLLPLGERYLALHRFAHAKLVNLDSGLVMHAFCAGLRACLQEHIVGVAQLEQQHRARGLSLHQMWYYLQPAARSLAVLDDIVGSVGNCRGGALLRALHERRRVLSGDVESSELLEFLLSRTAIPFLDMLHAWVHEGICRDPYAEFMIVERPTERREELVSDFNCMYWQRRFYIAPQQVPAFLEPYAEQILTTGKSLHVVRECGRMPAARPAASSSAVASELAAGGAAAKASSALLAPVMHSSRARASAAEPPDMAPFTLEERVLASRLHQASTWAAAQLVALLLGEHQLMARFDSVKHYFLLDQGDFFVHFLDSAEEELTKPVGEISRARLQSKLEIALRQSAVADPYRDSLTCGLLPYNLTNQLLRIINASRTQSQAAPPPPQHAARTPGLDAFTFEYAVDWPLSLVLSKHAITKYAHAPRARSPPHRPNRPHPTTMHLTTMHLPSPSSPLPPRIGCLYFRLQVPAALSPPLPLQARREAALHLVALPAGGQAASRHLTVVYGRLRAAPTHAPFPLQHPGREPRAPHTHIHMAACHTHTPLQGSRALPSRLRPLAPSPHLPLSLSLSLSLSHALIRSPHPLRPCLPALHDVRSPRAQLARAHTEASCGTIPRPAAGPPRGVPRCLAARMHAPRCCAAQATRQAADHLCHLC